MKLIICSCGTNVQVDDEDYSFLSRFTWFLQKSHGNSYATTNINVGDRKITIRMHRLVMGMKKQIIDHIDRNSLNNKKSNLRYCTNGQNQANSNSRKNRHGFKGLVKSQDYKRYRAQLRYKGKRYRSKLFETPEEAALAYDKMAIEFHGQFACLNFPEKAKTCLEKNKKP